MSLAYFFSSLLLTAIIAAPVAATDPVVLDVWPGKPPGETKELPPEADLTKPEDKLIAGRRIIKLGNVSTPQIAVYRPAPEKSNGTAVIVCPGGGHNILAYDLEGTEVAEWLNSLGVTGIVLKYRVPFRDPEKRWIAAVQDAQRAMSLVRSKAAEWQIDPQRIGICGFSAGGETAGLTALFEQRPYELTDAIDSVPWRPNFAMLVYPGGLIEKGEAKLREYIAVAKDAPPMFFVHAFDDHVSVQNSLALASELKKVGVPAELHVFARGGHGYGLRSTAAPVTHWPSHAAEWLKDSGYLTSSAAVASPGTSSLGNPADHLPPHIRQIARYGERADFSHDGRRILFLSKQFGDVMEYETATGAIRCLSQHFKHHGFNRAMYLSNGDILLTGPDKTFDMTDKKARTEARQHAMSWVLDKSGTKPPVPLSVQMVEGPAVSRTKLQIAWTHDIEGKFRQTGISLGELEYQDGKPRIHNARLILTSEDFPTGRRPRMIETQNFTPDGTLLTVTAYLVENGHNSDGYLFDIAANKLINFTDSPDLYEEVEGIFPDGRSTLVERGRSTPKNPWAMADAWRIWFDGTQAPQRLTRFLDFPGYKATNYVVSDDGRWMAFQIGKAGDEAGVGYGLFLMDLTELPK
ncbi:MAG: hypothetical protein C0483_21030 [Pirellula sp.]|nr:hypothetical protein [Pirellula sp.]